MADQITKAELVDILENDDSAKYCGTFPVNTETRAYYVTAFGVSDPAKRLRLVYIVV